MDLACAPVAGGVHVRVACPDHVHRVLLTAQDGVVPGRGADRQHPGQAAQARGADDLFGGLRPPSLDAPARPRRPRWLAAEFAECADTCSADFDDLHLELEKRDDAVSFAIEAR